MAFPSSANVTQSPSQACLQTSFIWTAPHWDFLSEDYGSRQADNINRDTTATPPNCPLYDNVHYTLSSNTKTQRQNECANSRMVCWTVGTIKLNLRTEEQRHAVLLSKSCFLLQGWNDTVNCKVQTICVFVFLSVQFISCSKCNITTSYLDVVSCLLWPAKFCFTHSEAVLNVLSLQN